ncbi:hypothetical protein [Nocardiopsis aegyptia]|uniref:Uncharacterized protein n=1 Tax=Nocardiopsis aegyptia TaxID=220378 RepID=A0A7Z0ENV0_9ACTN|nr:hypothetical protein [Nocardiopsis aegyptia]NYJ34645.1 hypothetical protein [Nocardiopsis aegyptia]
MRPDAEPRQPQSSPTPAPPAPPASHAPTAPRRRGTGRKVLVGVGAAVLVLGSATAGLAGGVLHGGASLQPLDGEGAAPDTAEARSEAAPAEDPGERVEFRGMSVLLPEGWAAETVTDSFGAGAAPEEGRVSEDWTALYPEGQEACEAQEWSWTDTSTGCRHLKLLGPGGIAHGGAGWAAVTMEPGPGSTYTASGNAQPCPEGEPTFTEADPERPAADQGTVEESKVGGEPASFLVASLTCVDEATATFTSVEQRLWLVPGAEILVVDNYRFEETEALLASAQW